VESAVYALAREVISDGHPVLQRYGVSDNDAFAVGLTCGGILDVFVEKVSQQTFPELADVAADIQAGRPVAIATVVEHPDARRVGRRMIVRPADDSEIFGSVGSPRAEAAVADDVRGLLAAGKTELLTYGPDGERRGEGCACSRPAMRPRPEWWFRCDRLRRCCGPARQLSRLPSDRLRRATCVRDSDQVP